MSKIVDGLLDCRVPSKNVVSGKAYLLHSRSGPVGIAMQEWRGGATHTAYAIKRLKHGHEYLFVEFDWESSFFPTVIPYWELPDEPPGSPHNPLAHAALLDWLRAMESKYLEKQQEVYRSIVHDTSTVSRTA